MPPHIRLVLRHVRTVRSAHPSGAAIFWLPQNTVYTVRSTDMPSHNSPAVSGNAVRSPSVPPSDVLHQTPADIHPMPAHHRHQNKPAPALPLFYAAASAPRHRMPQVLPYALTLRKTWLLLLCHFVQNTDPVPQYPAHNVPTAADIFRAPIAFPACIPHFSGICSHRHPQMQWYNHFRRLPPMRYRSAVKSPSFSGCPADRRSPCVFCYLPPVPDVQTEDGKGALPLSPSQSRASGIPDTAPPDVC